jgi:hypothetical protein
VPLYASRCELAPLEPSKVVDGQQQVVTSAGLLALELLRRIGRFLSREGAGIFREALIPTYQPHATPFAQQCRGEPSSVPGAT